MRAELSPYIEGDLEEIADWIARDNPRRAFSFIQEIREAFRRIAEDPLLYQLRPDIGEDARLAVVGRYVILFRTHGESSGSSASSSAAATSRFSFTPEGKDHRRTVISPPSFSTPPLFHSLQSPYVWLKCLYNYQV